MGLARHGGSETRFAGIVSAGFDALVNERANTWRRPRGKSRYTFALLRFLPKVFSGTHTTLDVVAFRTLRTVRIDAPGLIAYADGERIGPLPIDIAILPQALHVLI